MPLAGGLSLLTSTGMSCLKKEGVVARVFCTIRSGQKRNGGIRGERRQGVGDLVGPLPYFFQSAVAISKGLAQNGIEGPLVSNEVGMSRQRGWVSDLSQARQVWALLQGSPPPAGASGLRFGTAMPRLLLGSRSPEQSHRSHWGISECLPALLLAPA